MNIYGVRGYPTPDFTDERHCRTFSIPNTTIALGVFMGALWTLADEANWQAYGDMTPAEAAEAFQDVIWQAYADDEGICPVVEAPYWDTYDNADDQEPEGETEGWYGELVPAASFRAESLLDDELTWRENIAIWATAGFIAYSGQIGAAIAFIPFARRFVLKFRGNPLGAIAEIFLDGARLATLDTASAEDRIKAIDIILPDDEDEHEIWVAVGEDSPEGSTLQVVRKELDEAEVYPNSLRYNPDTDTVQYTPDGGETWIDDPDDDPRTGAKFVKPLKTGSDIRCRSAASMVKWLRNFIEYEAGVLETGATVIAVANSALALFDIIAPFAILATIIIDIAGTLFGIGGAALTAAFDEDTWALLLCIFDCNIRSDGSVTDEQFAEIQTEITEQLNTTAALVLNLILSTQGRVGLQNAGTLYEVEDADCSECDCEWCHVFDFTIDGQDWVQEGWWTGTPTNNYIAGVGWQSNYNGSSGNYIAYEFAGTTAITQISGVYDAVGSVTSNNAAVANANDGSSIEAHGAAASLGTDQTFGFDFSSSGTWILVQNGNCTGGGGCDGSQKTTLKRVTVRGTGDNPFGDNNC